jgi:hypothetical protein
MSSGCSTMPRVRCHVCVRTPSCVCILPSRALAVAAHPERHAQQNFTCTSSSPQVRSREVRGAREVSARVMGGWNNYRRIAQNKVRRVVLPKLMNNDFTPFNKDWLRRPQLMRHVRRAAEEQKEPTLSRLRREQAEGLQARAAAESASGR